LVGTIVPGLPGVGLVFGGILLHAIFFGIESVGMTTLFLLGAVTLFSLIIDVLASLYGAKRSGATRSGIIGSVVGGLAGLVILNLPGLFFGTFIGAVAGEYFLAEKSLNDALKAGTGSILGFLAGSVIKFIIALIMVIVFAAKVWF
jgi:uncharacterized protein